MLAQNHNDAKYTASKIGRMTSNWIHLSSYSAVGTLLLKYLATPPRGPIDSETAFLMLMDMNSTPTNRRAADSKPIHGPSNCARRAKERSLGSNNKVPRNAMSTN